MFRQREPSVLYTGLNQKQGKKKVESSMMTPAAFSYGLIKNGVTTVVADAHEKANVFGVSGVLAMMRASKDCPADIFFAVPSSVPSTDLETSGGEIDLPDIKRLLQEPNVICLGEVMNYPESISLGI